MKNKNLSFYSLIFFIVQACTCAFIINDSIKLLKNDAYLIPIFGTMIGYFILKFYLNKDFKRNIFVDTIFFIISIVYINTLLLVLVNFINSQYLYNTPLLFTYCLLVITIIYILRNGTRAIFYTSLILAFIMIIMYLFGLGGLIKQIDITNIMPILNNKLVNIIPGIFNYVAYTTSPLFIILYYQNIKYNNKKIIKTYLLSNLIILISIFIIICVFGINLCELYQFPAYHILKNVFEGAIIERFEKLLALYWIMSMFIPIIFFSNTVLKIMNNFKYKYIILIIILLINTYFFSNSNILKNFNETIFPIIMNLSIIISLFIKNKVKTT